MPQKIRYQRNVLEHVIDKIGTSFVLETGQTYLLNNGVIFLAGISSKIGSFTDLRGLNIAIFTRNPGDSNQIKFDPKRSIECGGAILLRNRESQESEPDISPNLLPNCLAVEGLRIFHQDARLKRIFFRQNGNRRLFLP